MAVFSDQPAAYFANGIEEAHLLSRNDQEELQLAALQERFVRLRDAIVPLRELANAAQLEQIDAIDQVGPLLFPHTLFKWFPPELLAQRKFDRLSEWLGRLTTNDLSAVASRSFESVDAWMGALDSTTDVWISHSSGTTGTISLYPRGKQEIKVQQQVYRACVAEWAAPGISNGHPLEYGILWPSYAGGRSAALRGIELFRSILCRDSSKFVPLLPFPMSTDWQIFIAEVETARREGRAPPEPTPYVAEHLDRARRFKGEFKDRVELILGKIRTDLAGTKVMFAGGPINMFQLAAEGLKAGMTNVLAPGSVVRPAGGLKGMPEPARMEETIRRFAGVKRLSSAYGMTELTTHFNMCPGGRYHVPPWIIPMVVERDTGAVLPRRGVQVGRAAYMDLLPRTYWGGLVSADEVELSWQPCVCGRKTPHVAPRIVRVEPAGVTGHTATPAASGALDAAHRELNRGLC